MFEKRGSGKTLNRARALLFVLGVFLPFSALPVLSANSETIFVLRYEDTKHETAHAGLLEGLEDEFSIIEQVIPKGEIPEKDSKLLNRFKSHLESDAPRLIVLMGDRATRVYEAYQASERAKGREDFPPAVSLMGLFAKERYTHLLSTHVVTYEIPPTVVWSQVRDDFDVPINRVGVLYRSDQESFIQEGVKRCKEVEQIELIGIRVDLESGQSLRKQKRLLRSSLDKLLKEHKVDALWVLNDNILLSRSLLESVWLPKLKLYKNPIVVGLDRFLLPPFELGQISISADDFALGEIVASLIFDIHDNGWVIPDSLNSATFSNKKVVNHKLMRRSFKRKLDRKLYRAFRQSLSDSGVEEIK